MDRDDRDGFVDNYTQRKQQGKNKRSNSRRDSRDGGKKMKRVGSGEDHWKFNRNALYEEDNEEESGEEL